VFLYGSPSLVQQLLAHSLVDELRLMIEPIVLGGGKRLFAEDGRALPLQLVSTRTSATGVHVCVYRPA
jgi:dihydrofolate reductase